MNHTSLFTQIFGANHCGQSRTQKSGLLGCCMGALLSVAGCALDARSDQGSTAAVAQAVLGDASGFAWAQSSAGSYNADSSYSSNSSGGTNHITWLEVGRARVDFPGLGSEIGGNVQVTAYGSTSHRCKVESWSSDGVDLSVFVHCHATSNPDFIANGDDTSANTRFTVSYVRRSGAPGLLGGYVWANNPAAASYTPSLTYQWNSSGGAITIDRTGVGAYTVTVPGQDFTGGTVQVTAYGSGSEHCKVYSWNHVDDEQHLNVRCFTSDGAPTDTRFTAAFSRESIQNSISYAYAWANQPSTASYTPSLTYQDGHESIECGSGDIGDITVTRSGVGRYSVLIPYLATTDPNRSNVLVTAYGSGSDHCKVVNWFASGQDETVNVACFDATGTPVDAKYAVAFASTNHIVC
jgi:hypothetical protein